VHKLNFYIASHVNANGVLFMRSRAVINRIITPVKKEKKCWHSTSGWTHGLY